MDISFFWHLHQPIYRSPENNQYILPWVNYHAIKNYYQMAFLAEEAEFPCTFNIVPCLLEQMDEYSKGQARDPFLDALEIEPDHLTPASLELLKKFVPGEEDRARLQLLALLSFFSPVIKTRNEKDAMLQLLKTIQKDVIPYYKRLSDKGLIELTTSAYYHPLLPLIFDIKMTDEGRVTSLDFQHPEDGIAQIKKGRDYFKTIFGRDPAGFWPSEGGISPEVARAVSQSGFSFAVTDENILWKSLEESHTRKSLYKPHVAEGLTVFFRDSELSNLLSFEYQKWNEEEAVSHFLTKLEERKKRSDENSICVIALDGENPWAHYRQNGVPFLRKLYRRIKENEGLRPVLLQDYLKRAKPEKEIQIATGTWLGNFSKWIGIPAKNRAWRMLSQARKLCGPGEEILIAEGSDWFWWYGEENVAEFDFLFKGYIRKAYELSGIQEPA